MKIIKCKFWLSRISIKKLNFIPELQRWMDSVQGQTFMNYAYSIGAAIVILGTLFKLTYLPGSNFFLFLGMGTEVIVFILAAFDRPFRIRNEEAPSVPHNSATVGGDPKTLEKLQAENLNETFDAVKNAYASQLDTIDKGTESMEQMQEEAKALTEKFKELNGLYSRMIDAVKVKE